MRLYTGNNNEADSEGIGDEWVVRDDLCRLSSHVRWGTC